MKKIEAVIRASDLDNVKNGLAEVLDGPMIANEAMCCGPSVQEVRVYRGSSYICDAVPCVWLHVTTVEESLSRALDVLRTAVQHGPGREMGILVSDVQRVGALPLRPSRDDGHRVRDESVHEDEGEPAATAWSSLPRPLHAM
jgi:nitrogen regulatory protein PII